MTEQRVIYGFEAERTLKVGFIGCGGHAFRNVYPVLRYVPVDLVAVCDLDEGRAEQFARMFGARRHDTDHRELLACEDLDCVFIVTSYDQAGRITHADLAAQFLRAGVATWVEKPPVNCLEEISMLREAMAHGRADYAVGFKKAFTPAARRVRGLLDADAIGSVSTISLRYPQVIPTVDDLLSAGVNRTRLSFLDHLGHPAALLQYLGGNIDSVMYRRTSNGAGFATLQMASGAVANLHFAVGASMRTMAERTEIGGETGTIFIENNIRVTHAPHASPDSDTRDWGAGYGRDADFTGQSADGCLVWEPEFSLGSLYNKGLFLMGYYNEISAFVTSVLGGTPTQVGGIDYAEQGIRLFEAFANGPDRLIAL